MDGKFEDEREMDLKEQTHHHMEQERLKTEAKILPLVPIAPAKLSDDDLQKFLGTFQRHKVRKDDLVVLTAPQGVAPHSVERLEQILLPLKKKYGVQVLILAHGMDLEKIEVGTMNRMGWYKKVKP